MKNSNTTTTTTTTTTTATTTTLPLVEFTRESVLNDLESADGQKCESWGAQFRVITEANFQRHCTEAMQHGYNGGMMPKEW